MHCEFAGSQRVRSGWLRMSLDVVTTDETVPGRNRFPRRALRLARRAAESVIQVGIPVDPGQANVLC